MNKFLIAFFFVCNIFTYCKNKLFEQKHSIQMVQTKNKALIGVEGFDYQGTIFTKRYPFKNLLVSDIDSSKIFTPSLADVESAEDLLRHQLKIVNKLRPNQQFGNPVLHRNLPSYFRQYVGYIDKKGNKIVHINFHWNIDDFKINYESDYSIVFDGGSNYWQINANITKKELTDLSVNGSG